MDNTNTNFLKRKEEIEEYFKFLETLKYDTTVLKYGYSPIDNQELIISHKLQKILIANTFLLLYNLVESTIRNSILEIYTKISDDGITYQNLSEKMKKVWLEKTVKHIMIANQKTNTTREKLQRTVDGIINNEIIKLTSEDIIIAGNVDAEKIRKLAEQNGFTFPEDGSQLAKIKDKRNDLAHGNKTFDDIGKDFTYNDLNSQKQEVFKYLTKIINNIELFINNDKYKC